MNRRLATWVVTLALAACGGGAGSPDDNADVAPAAAPVSVDFYSDSIGAGYSVTVSPGERMAQIRPGWVIVDHSVNGLKLSELSQVFDALPRSSKYVVIALGINDANAGEPQFERHLRHLIERARGEGRVPVLSGVVGTLSPRPLAAQYNAVTHQLAREYGLQHAGWNEAYRAGDVSADGLHRTQDASDRLTDLLVAAIERAVREEEGRKKS